MPSHSNHISGLCLRCLNLKLNFGRPGHDDTRLTFRASILACFYVTGRWLAQFIVRRPISEHGVAVLSIARKYNSIGIISSSFTKLIKIVMFFPDFPISNRQIFRN